MALQATTALANITLQATASSVTFNSIPNTYRDLILTVTGSITGSQGNNRLYFNNDFTEGNYLYCRLLGDGTNVGTEAAANATVSDFTTGRNQAVIEIIDYSADNKFKNRIARGDNLSSTVIYYMSRWSSNAPVTSITYNATNGGSWAAGTSFALYGRIA